MKKILLVLLPFICLVSISWRSLGPGAVAGKKVTGAPGDDGTCGMNGCHSNSSGGAGSVSLSFGGVNNNYVPGNIYPITITVSDATKLEGGFQTVALKTSNNTSVGTFIAITNTHTVVLSGRTYFEHGPPKLMTGGVAQWIFNWTAPSTDVGNIKFYVGGLASNNNNHDSGDKTYTSFLEIAPVPPVANFTASPTSVCQHDTVTFTDASTGNITSWSWNFGAGASPPTSSTQGPHHVTYSTFGNKTVSLTVSGPDGSDAEVKSNFINVIQNPTADYEAIPNIACTGDTIHFNSTSAPVLGLTSCSWDFADGNSISNDCFVTHAFSTPGDYLVKLTVVDLNGCSDPVSQLISINARPHPTLTISNGLTLCPGQTTNLSVSNILTVNGWYNGGIFIPNSAGQNTITISSSGNYYASTSDFNNCPGNSDTAHVIVFPLIPLHFSPNGDSIACSDGFVLTASAGFTNYQWKRNGITISNSGNTLVPPLSGSYTLDAIDANGCATHSTDTLNLTLHASPIVSLPSSVQSCDTVLLDAGNDGTNYLWSTGATTTSIQVTTSGLYSVTVSNSFGCSVTRSSQVDITSILTLNLGTDTTTCGSVILDAGAGFGAYLWNDASTGQTLNATQTGTYWVSVVDASGTCSASDTIHVIVATPPIVSIGNDTAFCTGEVYTVSPGNNFASYIWSTGATTPSIDITVDGDFWVVATDSNGCSGSDTINIEAFPLPAIHAGLDREICLGDTVHMFGGGGLTFSWSPASGLSDPFISSPVATPSITTNYTLTGVDIHGCENTDQILITVNPLPAPPSFIAGDSITPDTLTCTVNGMSYQWYMDGDPMINGITQTIIVTEPGSYFVAVIDSNGCSSASDEIEISEPDFIKPVFDPSIYLFPNPAREVVYFEVKPEMIHSNLEIINQLGQIVIEKKLESSGKVQIDLTTIPQGLYLLLIKKDIKFYTARLLRQ